MSLKNIITGPENVVLNLKAGDRWAAIEELIDHLCATGDISPDIRDSVAKAVRTREETMSTGVGHGVGIPHAATPHVSETVGAIGISQKGIDFEAMDGQPVHLVMLFVVQESEFQNHLETLADVARALTKPERCDALRQASNAHEVVRLIHDPEL